MTVQPHMITFSKEERQRADELEDLCFKNHWRVSIIQDHQLNETRFCKNPDDTDSKAWEEFNKHIGSRLYLVPN